MLMGIELASAGSPHPPKYMSTDGMKDVYARRLLVKVNGANKARGQAASLTREQLTRFSARIPGAKFLKGLDFGGWTLWEIPSNVNPRTAWTAFRQDRDVICSEPVNRVYPVTLPVPNDADWSYVETSSTFVLNLGGGLSSGGGGKSLSGFRRLWNLWDINAVTDDTGGVVSGGWAIYPGQWYTAANKPTDCPIIAIVDTGLDMDHPDFINAGGTGTDVSKGGQLMKSLSAYFQNGQVVPGGDPTDLNGHGTHVAGIALAAGNNGSFSNDGVIGVGYNSRGAILRVFDAQGNASDIDAAAAIKYAADKGIPIISLSLGTTSYSQLFQDAVTYATQKGSLVIAAGNESGSGGGNLGPIYPAGCSGALGVTANAPGLTQASDYYAGYGNYVGIAAPGGDLLTVSTTEQLLQYVFSTGCRYPCALSQDAAVYPPYTLNYTYLVGTSMACPHVSGAAGLFYGQNNLHQSDGFANLKAFQALQQSSMATNGSTNGGWQPTQGFGSLDVQGLLQIGTNSNPRGATVGDVTGIVYYGGTPVPNAKLTATMVTPPYTSFVSTTFADGTYRFDSFPPGIYDVTANPFGSAKTKRVQVTAGCDMPGVDFFTGPAVADPTPPTIARFKYLGGNSSSLSFDQWAYDTETEIDSAVYQIGTTPNGSNIVPPQIILPGNTRVNISGLNLPNHYFVTFNYTNGVGSVSRGVRAVTSNSQDANVMDSIPTTDKLNSHLLLKAGATGNNAVGYLSIDLTHIPTNIADARVTLTGGAVGSPVPIGVYGTSNSNWSEIGLNWNNGPAISSTVVDEQTVSTQGNYTWNITSLVKAAKLAGSSMVTVAFKCDSPSSTGASFGSRRARSIAPLVQITAND